MGPLASSIIWVCIIIVFQTHDGTFGMFNNLTISHNTWNPTPVSESTQTLLLHVRAPPQICFLETKILSFIPPYPCIIYFSSTLLYQQQKKTVAIKETTQWKKY